MAIDLDQFISYESQCGYLPDKKSRFHYLIINECPLDFYESLLYRGFRRFGKSFFRHHCRNCNDCISIRIPVSQFKPNKSQRKAFNKNNDIRVELGQPECTEEHLNLYNKYHLHQHQEKNWPFEKQLESSYIQNYVEGANDYGYEVKYFLNDKLCAVGYIDILKNAISSIYFFYDPELKSRSLGTFSVLTEMNLCKQFDLEYLFLGYWVEKCPSMQYKAKFKPHELMHERPNLEVKPNWIKPDFV